MFYVVDFSKGMVKNRLARNFFAHFRKEFCGLQDLPISYGWKILWGPQINEQNDTCFAYQIVFNNLCSTFTSTFLILIITNYKTVKSDK